MFVDCSFYLFDANQAMSDSKVFDSRRQIVSVSPERIIEFVQTLLQFVVVGRHLHSSPGSCFDGDVRRSEDYLLCFLKQQQAGRGTYRHQAINGVRISRA